MEEAPLIHRGHTEDVGLCLEMSSGFIFNIYFGTMLF